MPTSGPSRMTRLAARIAVCGLALALAAALGAVFQRGAWSWPRIGLSRPAPSPVRHRPEDPILTDASGPALERDATANSSASRAGEVDREAGSAVDLPEATPEPTPRLATSGRHREGTRDHGEGDRDPDRDRDDSATLFTTMERLERLIGAGMARARASVVSLEYTSAEASPGSRRMACGVVINASGDLLSVRIDRPMAASTPVAAPAPASPPAASPSVPPAPVVASPAPLSPIVARDVAGRRHLAHWVAYDPESGLTLLQIPARAVRPIEIAPEEPVLGGQVFVTGNAFGLSHTVSRGYVAGLDRALKLGVRQLGGLIQVQARIYPGDSGAAVTNQRGQLLGLIRSGLAPPAAGEPADQAARGRDRDRDSDFGFAIAARDLLWVADQLRAHGHVDRAYLGVRLEPAAGAAEASDNPLAEGAALQEVIKGGPAAAAGLRAGDLIVAIDDQPVRSPSDLTDRLDRLPSQALVRLSIIRGLGAERRPISMELRASSRPDASSAQAMAPASPTPTPAPNTPAPVVADRRAPAPGVIGPPLNVVPTAATPSPTALSPRQRP